MSHLRRFINPVQDGPFWGCAFLGLLQDGREGVKKPTPSLKICYTYPCNDETWHSYSLTREDPENI